MVSYFNMITYIVYLWKVLILVVVDDGLVHEVGMANVTNEKS